MSLYGEDPKNADATSQKRMIKSERQEYQILINEHEFDVNYENI